MARARTIRVANVVLGLATLLSPAAAIASMYTGYGDTGFGYTNKADCCDEAVFLAQDDSAAACERAGGFPDYRKSAARGRCETERTRGAQGRTVFRCTATASVKCS